MTSPGFVYAIVSGNAVKIGWSKDPWKRIHNLQIGSSADQRLVGYFEGSKEREGELHWSFDRYRIRGEWFRNEGPVKDFVSSLPPPAPKERKPDKRTAGRAPKAAREWGPVRRQLSKDLKAVVDIALAELSLFPEEIHALAHYYAKHPDDIASLKDGSQRMVAFYTEPLLVLSFNWPPGVLWPMSVTRPAPSAKIVAQAIRLHHGMAGTDRASLERKAAAVRASQTASGGISMGLLH